MKKTILFDIFPASGHYNASFAIAEKLKLAGHNVVFCVNKEFEAKVEKSGFSSVIACSRFTGSVYYKGISHIIEFFTNARKKVFEEKVTDFNETVKKINPDIVILDSQLSLKIIAYHMLKIPVVFMETKPLSVYDPWVPPFTSDMVPQKKIFSLLRIQYLWYKVLLFRKLDIYKSKILCLGNDNYTLHKNLAAKYNFEFSQRIDLKRPFIIGFKEVDILSMTPSCFDFPRKHSVSCYFAESRVNIKREDICSRRYLSVIEKFEQRKKELADTRLVYCSLGTVSSGGKRYNIFFKKMKELCEISLNCIFIMSVGERYDITRLLPLPSNMFVFQWVPQLDILCHSDVMITHGGMNSIAECIGQEVPMLVFPLSLRWDQPGNAARVEYHGLGIKGNIQKNNVKSINLKLQKLFREHQFYKKNLSCMKSKMISDKEKKPEWWKLLNQPKLIT